MTSKRDAMTPSACRCAGVEREEKWREAGRAAEGADVRRRRWSTDFVVYFFHQSVMVVVFPIFFCSCSTPYSSASAVGGQPGT